MAWSALSLAVLQYCLTWLLSLLLYQWSHDMTCLLFVSRHSGWSLLLHVIYLFPGSWSTSFQKSLWGYSRSQSLLRWPMPLHCQHMGHPGLLCLASTVCGSKSAPGLTSLADGLTVSFTASCLRAWSRAASSILLPQGGRTSLLSPLSC